MVALPPCMAWETCQIFRSPFRLASESLHPKAENLNVESTDGFWSCLNPISPKSPNYKPPETERHAVPAYSTAGFFVDLAHKLWAILVFLVLGPLCKGL